MESLETRMTPQQLKVHHKLLRSLPVRTHTHEAREQAEKAKNILTMGINSPIEFKGEVRTIAQWAIRFMLDSRSLLYRLKRGWDLELALITPRMKPGKKRPRR